LPEHTGFSVSCPILVGINEAARFLCRAGPLELLVSGGLDISESFRASLDDADLLENIVFGSAVAAANDVLGDLLISPLVGRVELEVLGVVVDEFEKEEKTEPSTRFAFSREASFPNSTLNLDGYLVSGGGGSGLRSKGTKPAGRRVLCME